MVADHIYDNIITAGLTDDAAVPTAALTAVSNDITPEIAAKADRKARDIFA